VEKQRQRIAQPIFMLTLSLPQNGASRFRVLCLGCHSDDIEIGCGGTVLTFAAAKPEMQIFWVVFSSDEERKIEALNSAGSFLANISTQKVIVHGLRDGFLPYSGAEVKERFEQLKTEFSPELILTHYGRDLHQDHRFISELTWNTFRDHLILEYEIPKYDGDFGSPNADFGLRSWFFAAFNPKSAFQNPKSNEVFACVVIPDFDCFF